MSNEKFNPSTTYQLVKQKRKGPKTKDISAKRYSKMLKRFRKKGSKTGAVDKVDVYSTNYSGTRGVAQKTTTKTTTKPNAKKTIISKTKSGIIPINPINIRG
tara:strand:- start:62 stop:367 length:306 start_codon:yes stop_codon:yes gene_type:complete